MATITTTDVDRGGVVLAMGKSRDVTIEYRHADDTYVEGTLLAFDTTEEKLHGVYQGFIFAGQGASARDPDVYPGECSGGAGRR